ncbi:hypothetical protein [Pedobacter sp. JY14-1]|uniref:hypothetical protein n=1 Tax=Pedobacter sp. JY14-1 TaxID=3034151 RepID=UPI0023E2F613|nr:hypothetical protein [Pedobacter sp. JY14-1]
MRKTFKNYAASQDDHELNELAVEWYFLNLFFLHAAPRVAETVVDALLDAAHQLKPVLSHDENTFLSPRRIDVDFDVSFDIWLDADGDIGFSGLEARE